MFTQEICSSLKMDICDYIKKSFEFEEGNYMETDACLACHEVYRLNKKFNFAEFGWDANPEYVMFLEKCKKGMLGYYQIWDFFAFTEKELEKVAKASEVFSYDELRCMEPFEHWDEE